MSQAGLGVLIHSLFGRSENPADYYGARITDAAMLDDKLHLALDTGKSIVISDEGQSCCESRYMTCDDDLTKLIGGTLTRIEAKDGPDVDDGGECHETAFVEVGTDECFITICTHNQHNGYYGGFSLTISEEEA